MTHERKYWFKAKESGLGWSTPLTWQGWVVYAAMFGGIAASFVFGADVGEKILGTGMSVLACLPIYWLFGEPLSGKGSRRK